jgi:hypothetical protein
VRNTFSEASVTRPLSLKKASVPDGATCAGAGFSLSVLRARTVLAAMS